MMTFSDRLDKMYKSLLLTASELAPGIGVSPSLITEMRGGRIKGKKFWVGIRGKYPQWESFLRGDTDTPPPINLRDVAAYRAKEEQLAYLSADALQAELPAVIDDVTHIMRSGQHGVISALVSNVREFKRAVDMASELLACQERMAVMQEQIDNQGADIQQLKVAMMAGDLTGIEAVASSSTGKRET
jgi:hypothetical protein